MTMHAKTTRTAPVPRPGRLPLALTVMAFLLGACGGGGGGGETPAPPPPPPAPAPPPPAPPPPPPPAPPPPPPAPTVSSTAVDTPRYSQRLRFTVSGSSVNEGLTLSSAGCANFSLSTAAPDISTATTAYYTCTVTGLGDQTANVTRSADNVVLATVSYSVPVPQVTMNISNGAGANGALVITLTPAQSPITVNNFLNYVNAGFYAGTAFHRHSPNFVLQGGGFDAPLAANAPPPPLKTTTPPTPPITLEVGNGLSNTALTVAMARTSVLNSATSQFFINLANNAFLDTSGGGYAVFGSITAGAELVTAMRTATCTAWPLGPIPSTDCLPVPNLVITSATQTR